MTVDPDDYPIDDKGTLIAYFVGDDGKLLTEEMDVWTYNEKKPWPLLLVNTFEELPNRSLEKTGATAVTSGSYISLRAIDIKNENDPIGDEEFEIFDRAENLFEDVLNYCAGQYLPEAFDVKLETDWVFDGHSGTDAADRTRTFRDFNSDNGGYKDADGQSGTDIALIRLDSQKRGLTPIEDDNQKGEHHNNNTYDPCVDEYRLQDVRADRWDLGTEPWEELKFHVLSSGAQDDVYTYSGAYGFTLNNTTFFPSTWDADNADVGLRFVKETVN